MDDVSLADVDEALANVRASLRAATDLKDSRGAARQRARIDQLLEARLMLTRDLAEMADVGLMLSG